MKKTTTRTTVEFSLIKWLLRFIMLFGKKTLLKIEYNEGYNLNFEISEAEARSLLPEGFSPLKLKLCENDEEATYYLTWYLASMDTVKNDRETQRVDIFTYCVDDQGELALFFVSCIMDVPDFLEKRSLVKKMFFELFNFFARDTRTGESSYPHYFSQLTRATSSSFVVEYNDSLVKVDTIKLKSDIEKWDPVFVLANSQIYRNKVDKNINFFNQRFIDTDVYFLETDNIIQQNMSNFHPLCREVKSVHFYGSKDKPSNWYIEL